MTEKISTNLEQGQSYIEDNVHTLKEKKIRFIKYGVFLFRAQKFLVKTTTKKTLNPFET